MSARTACIQRDTHETQIEVEVDLDGGGRTELETGLPFLEHMLEQVARHGMMDLRVKARGDLSVDARYTVEDISIVLGQAMRQALGDKQAIRRYGHAYVPLDEALPRVVIDFSDRPGLNYQVECPRARIQDSDVDLVHEFFQGFVDHAMVTLHIDGLRGNNAHHVAETVFKAFGRAVRMAMEQDPRESGTPSAKGVL